MKYLFVTLIQLSIFAKLNVLTTTTDISWLVKAIGGERVKVTSLLSGTEDPHYVDAMPHWISKTSRADIVCLVGLELEIAWLPKVLQRSGNKKIQKGHKGYCNIGSAINSLEKVESPDRSMGDVHSGGNPHYHLSPKYFLQGASKVVDVLIENDSKGADIYLKNFEVLKRGMASLQKEVRSILKTSNKMSFMSYHKEFSYFVEEFKLNYVGEVEETPGVPPSAGRIARIGLYAKNKNVDLAIATKNNPEKIMKKFQEISGVPYKLVDISINDKGAKNYRELILQLAKAFTL